MGLDITAYEHAAPYEGPVLSDDDMWDAEDVRLVGVEIDRWRPMIAPLPEGWVSVSGAAYSFRAGSYSGYGSWREQLCLAALGVNPNRVWENPSAYAGRPFVELIDFTDCDGEIGGVTAAKLARDFEEQRDLVLVFRISDVDGWFEQKYDDWAAAFALAADDGLVVFH